jgi:hypothetical protein
MHMKLHNTETWIVSPEKGHNNTVKNGRNKIVCMRRLLFIHLSAFHISLSEL